MSPTAVEGSNARSSGLGCLSAHMHAIMWDVPPILTVLNWDYSREYYTNPY